MNAIREWDKRLRAMGYEIAEDPDLPGRFYWKRIDTQEGSGISFASMQDAWEDLCRHHARTQDARWTPDQEEDEDEAPELHCSPTRFSLTIDLDIALNGMPAKDMEAMLREAVATLMNRGLVTGDSAAEIDRHDVRIDRLDGLAGLIGEEELQRYFADRLENGAMDLESLPARMARLALMRPTEALAEFAKRMDELGYFDEHGAEADAP